MWHLTKKMEKMTKVTITTTTRTTRTKSVNEFAPHLKSNKLERDLSLPQSPAVPKSSRKLVEGGGGGGFTS